MKRNETYENTIHFWIATRVNNTSASMVYNGEEMDMQLLKELDEQIKPILDTRKEYAGKLNNEHNPSQKFKRGSRVTISNPISWFARESEGQEYTVGYSYGEMFGGSDYNNYSLIDDKGNSTAWYNVEELKDI